MNSIIEQTSNFTSPYKHHSTPNINTNNPLKSNTDIAFTRSETCALFDHTIVSRRCLALVQDASLAPPFSLEGVNGARQVTDGATGTANEG